MVVLVLAELVLVLVAVPTVSGSVNFHILLNMSTFKYDSIFV